jgi:uncharacterized protein (DUF2147 family)
MRLVERHPSVPAGSAEADVVSFEYSDFQAGVALLEEIGGNEAGVAAAETDDVGVALTLERGLEARAIDRLEPEALVRSESR